MDDTAASGLSGRGSALSGGALPPYFAAHVERRDDPGYTGLAVAEDLLVTDLLLPRLGDIPAVPPHVVAYGENGGGSAMREAVADLLGRHLAGRPIDPDHVRVLAGASGVLDAVGHALGDPGDVVLVPTPSYAGFWPDLEVRPGLRIQPVPTAAEDGWALTPERLEAAAADAGGPVRALLLTNPDNPRGEVRPAAEVEAALAWAEARDLHVIADEIYGLSVFGATPFTSVMALRPSLGERLHVVWAVSKDLGMSGLRVGVLVSEHEGLRRAVEVQGMWQGAGAHTQHVLAAMLGDRAWVDGYLVEMRRRLAAAAAAVTGALDGAGIAHSAAEAGFFVLLDLRPWLDVATADEAGWAAEAALWQRILDGAGVNLTPGSALRAPEPGWFRLCYAANPVDRVVAAVQAVAATLRSQI